MNISVIGLGKLGCPFAAWLACKGHIVTGVDVNPAFVDKINRGFPTTEEDGLAELVKDLSEKYLLRATGDTATAVFSSDITFVVVPTPSERDGEFSLEYVLGAIDSIACALRNKEAYHLVVITSTVMPGHMSVVQERLERLSGKWRGEDFGLCYNPEFIALGSVLHDLEHPDFVLIGAEDSKSVTMLRQLYMRALASMYDKPETLRFSSLAPIHVTNFINAEIAKLALNCYVTMKISYANMLSMVCSEVPGADVDEITDVLGADSRIGAKYLRGGAPFGGPCFPRDNKAFRAYMSRFCLSNWGVSLPNATQQQNVATQQMIEDAVLEYSRPGDVVGIVGMAYKPGTSVTEESASIALRSLLLRKGREVLVYDPCVPTILTLRGLIENSDVVVIMLPLKEVRCYVNGEPAKRPGYIIDVWRCAEHISCDRYVPIGRGK